MSTRVLYAVLFLFLGLLWQGASSKRHPQYIVDRTAGQGKLWMSWAPGERERFVMGYVWAYYSGFRSGCEAYSEFSAPAAIATLEESPLQKCMLQQLDYSKDANYYQGRITSFYQTYPADSDLPLAWLMQAFSDSEHKTPDEINNAWSDGHRHP